MSNKETLEQLTKALLENIGENPDREGLIKTPTRVAKAWEFFSRGYNQNIDDIINGAIFNEDAKDMVIVRDIEFFSLCEHHLLPFFGKAHVGYIPNGKVIGLSKIPRIIDMYSRRLQVQERLTSQVADKLMQALDPRGALVVIEAEHLCMSMRGVQKPGSLTLTSAVRGLFLRDATRAEALQLLGIGR